MTNISANDIIYATVSSFGREIIRLSISGFVTVNDLVRYIITSMVSADTAGRVMIDLRNATRGWTSRHSVLIRA